MLLRTGRGGNKKQSVNEERAYICALQCTQLLTDLETLGGNEVELDETKQDSLFSGRLVDFVAEDSKHVYSISSFSLVKWR